MVRLSLSAGIIGDVEVNKEIFRYSVPSIEHICTGARREHTVNNSDPTKSDMIEYPYGTLVGTSNLKQPCRLSF
jgi:hypothetical protein